MSAAHEQLRESIGAAILEVIRDVAREEIQAAIRGAMPTAPASPKRPELLKVEQVADELQVKRTTVRTWIRNGSLKATLLGPAGKRREYRVRRTDLDAFVSGAGAPDAPDADAQVSKILGLDARRRNG